jgi:hypothetical protein
MRLIGSQSMRLQAFHVVVAGAHDGHCEPWPKSPTRPRSAGPFAFGELDLAVHHSDAWPGEESSRRVPPANVGDPMPTTASSSDVPTDVYDDSGKVVAQAKYMLVEEPDGRVWGALEVTDGPEDLPAYVYIAAAFLGADFQQSLVDVPGSPTGPGQIRLMTRLSGFGRIHLVELA